MIAHTCSKCFCGIYEYNSKHEEFSCFYGKFTCSVESSHWSTRHYPHKKEQKRRRLDIRITVISHEKCVEKSQKCVTCTKMSIISVFHNSWNYILPKIKRCLNFKLRSLSGSTVKCIMDISLRKFTKTRLHGFQGRFL